MLEFADKFDLFILASMDQGKLKDREKAESDFAQLTKDMNDEDKALFYSRFFTKSEIEKALKDRASQRN